MAAHKFCRDKCRRCFRVTFILMVVGIVHVVPQSPKTLSDVQFLMEPSDQCIEHYSEPVARPVFYCIIAGLTDETKVMWLRNDVAIGQEEYDARNYSLSGNRTKGSYDLRILRTITRSDDRSRYTCAVQIETNSTSQVIKSRNAKLRVYFYIPDERYPECSINVMGTSYKKGAGFTISCCSETVNPEMELVWNRITGWESVKLVGINASRKSEKDRDVCLVYDVTDHEVGDSYECQLTIPQISHRTMCRKHHKANDVTVEKRECKFGRLGIRLVQPSRVSSANDATFNCHSSAAMEYLWQFTPALDRTQYHVSDDHATVLLNLESLTAGQYSVGCTAVGEHSMGYHSLVVDIKQSDAQTQKMIKIVTICLATSVGLVLFLLLMYVFWTKCRILREDNYPRGLNSQEMRARIQIRRNVSGNAPGIYAFPSSRIGGSSSFTPLMEGPEDTPTEHGRPPSPHPCPSLPRPTSNLPPQGAVGGIILDEEEMIECRYTSGESDIESECDPKQMNVEGLQYADLEFSEDEEYAKDENDDDDSDTEDEEKLEKARKVPLSKPKVDYANIVHFDPRRNSSLRRNSEPLHQDNDPWKRNTDI